eukprot:PhF_6_TR44119/c0_g1_i3/m.67339
MLLEMSESIGQGNSPDPNADFYLIQNMVDSLPIKSSVTPTEILYLSPRLHKVQQTITHGELFFSRYQSVCDSMESISIKALGILEDYAVICTKWWMTSTTDTEESLRIYSAMKDIRNSIQTDVRRRLLVDGTCVAGTDVDIASVPAGTTFALESEGYVFFVWSDAEHARAFRRGMKLAFLMKFPTVHIPPLSTFCVQGRYITTALSLPNPVRLNSHSFLPPQHDKSWIVFQSTDRVYIWPGFMHSNQVREVESLVMQYKPLAELCADKMTVPPCMFLGKVATHIPSDSPFFKVIFTEIIARGARATLRRVAALTRTLEINLVEGFLQELVIELNDTLIVYVHRVIVDMFGEEALPSLRDDMLDSTFVKRFIELCAENRDPSASSIHNGKLGKPDVVRYLQTQQPDVMKTDDWSMFNSFHTRAMEATTETQALSNVRAAHGVLQHSMQSISKSLTRSTELCALMTATYLLYIACPLPRRFNNDLVGQYVRLATSVLEKIPL